MTDSLSRASKACAMCLGLVVLTAGCDDMATSAAALGAPGHASNDDARDGGTVARRESDEPGLDSQRDADMGHDTTENQTPRRRLSRDGSVPSSNDAAFDAAVQPIQDAASCDGDECPVACVADCAGNVPLLCSDAGILEPGEPCGVPAHICRDGQCVETETTFIGLREPTGNQRTLETKHLHASPFETNGFAVLRELNVLGSGAGGFLRFAIYADSESAGTHAPGALIASGIDSVMVAGDASQGTTPRGYATLEASTRYWIVVMTSTTPTTLYTEGAPEGRLVRVSMPEAMRFTDSFPATFPLEGALAVEGQRYSLFVGVQTEP